MKRYLISLILLFFSLTFLDAQSLLRRADIAYQEKNYQSAAKSYQKYYDKQFKKKGEVSYEVSIPLANSYYNLNDYSNAQMYYDKTEELFLTSQEWVNYGEILRKKGMYAEAIEKYDKAKRCRKKNVRVTRINLGIKSCKWAIEQKDKESMVDRGKLKPSGISASGQSFGVQFYEKGVVYSSPDAEDSKKVDENGRPILNLAYVAVQDGVSTSESIQFSETLASKNHVGSAEFSANGKTIYYTMLTPMKGHSKLKIYSAQRNATTGEWDNEKVMPFCDDRYNFAHPALSLDGNILYFSSDMRGTRGGMDIFMSKKTTSGWGRPTNVGGIVNTAATEIFPYITPDGYLSFASNGHPGFGGLDAFWVDMKNGRPVAIRNAYDPINSTYDDFAAVIDPKDTLRGYVSSNRDSEGLTDSIYIIEFTEDYRSELHGVNVDSILLAAYEDSVASVQRSAAAAASATYGKNGLGLSARALYGPGELGVVNTFMVDALTLQGLGKAKYTIVDNVTDKVILRGSADDSARVALDLKSIGILTEQALTVKVKVGKNDFSRYSLELVSDRMKTYDDIHPIMLTPIMSKREKVKENIIADEDVTGGAPFTFDAHTLTTAGRNYLDSWADFLIKNPTVKIKLMTHTDGRGDVSYNFRLSQRRAFEAKRYLISRGANHMQVIARGYGERYPLVDCVECSEEEHDTNRRIEVEVINEK